MKNNVLVVASFVAIVTAMVAYRIVMDRVRPGWKDAD